MTFSQRAVEAANAALRIVKSEIDRMGPNDAAARTLSSVVRHLEICVANIDGLALQGWQPIENAPRDWIIGYTSWGQHVGKFHEHVGPCQYVDDYHEFVNIDFDVFPSPTHWMPLPPPPAESDGEERK